ncbi:MAG: hypothetical protein M3094_07705 [Actinomycetia bacterium]|nr:hypothetical protein [Actinomycetes bacterium]
MTGNRWLGILVGTMIAALTLWFGFLAIPSNHIIGLVIVGVGLAFAMYAVAGFSGAADPMGTGFMAALIALVSGITMAIIFQSTGMAVFIVLAPVAAISLGGVRALAPTQDKQRNTVRLGISAAVAIALWLVFTVEPTAYGLVVPLVLLPALGIADRIYDRGKEIVDEPLE